MHILVRKTLGAGCSCSYGVRVQRAAKALRTRYRYTTQYLTRPPLEFKVILLGVTFPITQSDSKSTQGSSVHEQSFAACLAI